MNILVLGATGRVGSQLVSLALKDGHQVTALVRTPEKMSLSHPNLTVVTGDATNREDLSKVIPGQEAVVSALNTGGTTTLSESMPHIISLMKENGIRRIIAVGTAGILNSRTLPGQLRYQAQDAKRKSVKAAEEHHRMYDLLSESGLDWTLVCPTYLPDGEPQGGYRWERNYLPLDGSVITVGDTADFTYRQLFTNEHVGYRVGISY